SPLLGRDAALATLHTAYNSASLGHTVVALVEGPSGIGKSAIVDHFLRSLRRRDGDSVVVLRGRCYERESVPYKALDPIIDHLTRHLRRLPEAEIAALLPREVHALTRLFPALLDVKAIDNAPRRAPAEPQEIRTRAFSALQELLGRITDRRPLVLHIDDLQWTDDDSATLLADLLRPPNAPNLLLVATFRQEDATEANSSLARLINALTGTRPRIDIQRITVGPLPHAQATMLTSLLLRKHHLPESLADRLATECEGNPLFAGELIRHLAATAAASDIAPQDLISPRLSDVLGERIAGLPNAARRVLQAVAVAGRRLPQSVVLAAARVAEDDADPIVRLRSEHFVRTVGPTGARVIESTTTAFARRRSTRCQRRTVLRLTAGLQRPCSPNAMQTPRTSSTTTAPRVTRRRLASSRSRQPTARCRSSRSNAPPTCWRSRLHWASMTARHCTDDVAKHSPTPGTGARQLAHFRPQPRSKMAQRNWISNAGPPCSYCWPATPTRDEPSWPMSWPRTRSPCPPAAAEQSPVCCCAALGSNSVGWAGRKTTTSIRQRWPAWTRAGTLRAGW
ncbi:MAG: AAA family ATPase, partial [Nannocystaceae bacterium]|nr:AAA family ATPase [Nannocystaceae bacterium]